MAHLPSYYYREQRQQVEQLRREMQAFQQTMLEDLRKVLKGIEREYNHTNDVYVNVVRIKEEMKQVHNQVDVLVMHLLLPDLSLRKINEAIAEVTEYHEGLKKRQDAFDRMRGNVTAEITKLASALTALVSPEPVTDKMQKFEPDEEEEEHPPEAV